MADMGTWSNVKTPFGGNQQQAVMGGNLGGTAQYLAAGQDDARYQAQQGATADKINQMRSMLPGLVNAFNTGPQGGQPPNFTPTMTNPIPQLQMPDMTAANAAQFAKAKDQAGQTAKGALTGLQSAMGSSGMMGSGNEARGTANVVNQAQQASNDMSRQQAMTGAQLAQQTAEQNFQGGIAQRGQDIAQQTALSGQGLTAFEDAQNRAQQTKQSVLDAALKGLSF